MHWTEVRWLTMTHLLSEWINCYIIVETYADKAGVFGRLFALRGCFAMLRCSSKRHALCIRLLFISHKCLYGCVDEEGRESQLFVFALQMVFLHLHKVV